MPRIDGTWVWISVIGLSLIAAPGCGSGTEEAKKGPPSFPGIKLVAGAVGDPGVLATVASQRGEWSATRGAEVTLQESTVDLKSAKGVDVFLFPADRLGDLIDAGVLAAIPESVTKPPASSDGESTDNSKASESTEEKSAEGPADPLQYADVVPAFREKISRYGSDRSALPYGGSALVLVYDRSAFEHESNRKAAAEASLKLEPPKTWEEFDALAKFFQGRDWNSDGTGEHGVALALGPDPAGVGDAIYLARAASLGQHRDQYSFLFDSDTMIPRIDLPPFVEALQGLAALKNFGPSGMEAFDAEAARRAFAQGKAAMLIDRAELAASWGEHKGGIGVAPLPGSEKVYDPARKLWEKSSSLNRPSYLPHGGGWLVGVSSSADPKVREAALDFATYLISPETATQVRANRTFPMLPVRSTLIGQGHSGGSGVDSKQWADALNRTFFAEKVIAGLRIPESQEYLSDLAKARANVLKGENPEQALKAVAASWGERTARLGTARQLWHYRRSLNSLVTLPEPPAR